MAHGAVKFLLRVLEAAFLVVLLGAGVLAWRLNQGPVAINAIAPYVASVLEDLNPGLRFRIEHAEFGWKGFEGQPRFVIRNVRVLDASDNVIAGLPSLSAYLSVPALLKGDVAPERINLSNPIIRFVHRADGTLGLGVEGSVAAASNEAASGNILLAGLVGSLTTPPGADNPAGYLQSVSIDGTTLMLVDEVSGRRWLAPDATLGFERGDGDVEFRATLPVSEEGKSWDVTAEGRYVANTNEFSVAFSIDDFRPARIADLAPQPSMFEMIDLGLSGIVAADFVLESGGARIDAIRFDVRGNSGHVRVPSPVAFDYPIRSLFLKGEAGSSLDSITIEDFQVSIDRDAETTPTIKMSAVATNLNSAPAVKVRASLDDISIEALKEYWPAGVKPNTHNWIVKNLSVGGLTNTRAIIDLAGPDLSQIDATQLNLTSELNGMSVQYIQGMPQVQGAHGSMQVGLEEVSFEMRGGYVPDPMSDDDLRITHGKLRMHNLGNRGTELADFDIDIAGDFGAVMRLIDHEPFGYATAVGMDTGEAAGRADIKLALDFPLVKELKLDQVKIGVDAMIDGVAIPDVAFGLPLTDGRMNVVLDRDGMDVSGVAQLGGIPSAIQWRENFGGGEFRSRYVLDPVIDNEHRPSIGLGMAPFTPPYIDGSASAHVIYTVDREANSVLTAQVDLTEPAMAIPELGWHKASGIAAQADVEMSFFEGRLLSVPSFVVRSGDDLLVSGDATFGAEAKLTSLSIKPSTVGESRLSGTLKADDRDGLKIDVSGAHVNAASFLKEAFPASRDDEEKSSQTPITLHANIDRMSFTPEANFTNVRLNFESAADGVRAIDFKSLVGDEMPFIFTLTSNAEGRTFTGSSENGGGVVRAAGLFDDIVGGRLEINGNLDDDGIVRGQAEISDFYLVDAPVVARLLSVAALTGIVDELRGEGISFKTLRVPFSYANSTLAVEDGEMFGTSLGLTADGTYDFTASSMNFNGTVIPAYAINSALNSIPLLGNLFTGGDKGGGIFAATYSYRGDVATAEPTVNPLAALAPGFLRHIFDIFTTRPQEASSVRPGERGPGEAPTSQPEKDSVQP